MSCVRLGVDVLEDCLPVNWSPLAFADSYTLLEDQPLATVTLTITPVNDDPLAIDDYFQTDEDTPIIVDVLDNDSDVDGDNLTITGFTNPSHGSVNLNQDQTLTYTANPDWNGVDSFSYTVSDGYGGTATATVTIGVQAVNDSPDAWDDAGWTDEDTAVNIDVLANDIDAEEDTLQVTGVTGGASGSTTVEQDGRVTYTPNPNFFGHDSFSYTVDDGEGGTDTATVWMTVYPVNEPPVAVDDSFTVAEDSAGLSYAVLANDTDLESSELWIIDWTEPLNGVIGINDNGTITYRPDGDFSGVDYFTYTMWDGSGGEDTATVSVTVTPVSDAPIAYDDAYFFAGSNEFPPPAQPAEPTGLLANDVDYDFRGAGYDPANLQVKTDSIQH
jgi:hypothetical protein